MRLEIANLKAQLAAQHANGAAREKEITEDATASAAEPHERFMALGDYEVKGQATMHFSNGSSKLSSADQDELKNLAVTATGLKGYLIEVTGYADSNGAAAMNTTLSENRAKAVITYLFQQCTAGTGWCGTSCSTRRDGRVWTRYNRIERN